MAQLLQTKPHSLLKHFNSRCTFVCCAVSTFSNPNLFLSLPHPHTLNSTPSHSSHSSQWVAVYPHPKPKTKTPKPLTKTNIINHHLHNRRRRRHRHHHHLKKNLWKRFCQRPQFPNHPKIQFWRQKQKPFRLSFKTHFPFLKPSSPSKNTPSLFLSSRKHAVWARASPPPQPTPRPPLRLQRSPRWEKKTKQPAKSTSGIGLRPGRDPTPQMATSPAGETVGSSLRLGSRSRRRRRKSKAVPGQFGEGKRGSPSRRQIGGEIPAPLPSGGTPVKVQVGGRGRRHVLWRGRWMQAVAGKRLRHRVWLRRKSLRHRVWLRRKRLRRRLRWGKRMRRKRKARVKKVGRKTTSCRRKSASRTRTYRWSALFFCRSTFSKPFWEF